MDPYKILNVGKDADWATIRASYHAAAQKHHPDRGGDAWAFQQVQAAFETLQKQRRQSEDPHTQQTPRGAPADATQASSRTEEEVASERPAHDGKTPDGLESFRLKLKGLLNGATQELQFQSETCFFILVNVLDFYMTYVLLNTNGIEANPVAAYFHRNWDFAGMLAFKLVSVAIVCVIVQVVAKRRPSAGRFVLWAGILIVGAVVIYSALLIRGQFRP